MAEPSTFYLLVVSTYFVSFVLFVDDLKNKKKNRNELLRSTFKKIIKRQVHQAEQKF